MRPHQRRRSWCIGAAGAAGGLGTRAGMPGPPAEITHPPTHPPTHPRWPGADLDDGDGCEASSAFESGYCHSGMGRAALFLGRKLGPLLRPLHAEGLQITLVGHSLGAGAAWRLPSKQLQRRRGGGRGGAEAARQGTLVSHAPCRCTTHAFLAVCTLPRRRGVTPGRLAAQPPAQQRAPALLRV